MSASVIILYLFFQISIDYHLYQLNKPFLYDLRTHNSEHLRMSNKLESEQTSCLKVVSEGYD